MADRAAVNAAVDRTFHPLDGDLDQAAKVFPGDVPAQACYSARYPQDNQCGVS